MLDIKKMKNLDLLSVALGMSMDTEMFSEVTAYFGNLSAILKHSTFQELINIKGFGVKKANQLLAYRELMTRLVEDPLTQNPKITGPDAVVDLLQPILANEEIKHFKAVLLNHKNEVNSLEHLTTGTSNYGLLDIRGAYNLALRKNANSIIIVTNSITNDCSPSNEDITLGKRLSSAGELLGVKLNDFIILSSTSHKYTSFRQENLI